MAYIEAARRQFIAALCLRILGTKPNGDPTMSDGDNDVSVQIGLAFLDEIRRSRFRPKARVTLTGGEVGADFDRAVAEFLRTSFIRGMKTLRPGRFYVDRDVHIRTTAQYAHLETLRRIGEETASHLTEGERREFRVVTAGEYQVKADVVVLRRPERTPVGPRGGALRAPGSSAASATPLLHSGGAQPHMLHANVSCKWTFRSDRAQNIRTEAIALMRHRKGPMPHMVVVTAEPLPSRLRSVALGTGEVDCVYHIGLPELERALVESVVAAQQFSTRRAREARLRALDEHIKILELLTDGHRLRDISDLPFDLAI